MTPLLFCSGILPRAHSPSPSLVLSLRVLACLHLMTGKYSLNNSTSCFSVLLLNSHPHFSSSFWFTDDLLSTITDVSTLKLSSASLLCFLCRDFPYLLSRTFHIVRSTSSLTFLIDSSLPFPGMFSSSISFRKAPSPHFLEEPFHFHGLSSNYNADSFQLSWKALPPNAARSFLSVLWQFCSSVP